MEKRQKFKARLGLAAVAAILLGCLGILMVPNNAQGNAQGSAQGNAQGTGAESNAPKSALQAEPASHTEAPLAASPKL